MKRIIALLLTCLCLVSLASCGSAYDRPKKYLSLPDLSAVTVSNQELDERLKEVTLEILDTLSGEYYTPLASSTERVKHGDRVHVSFYPDAGQGLSEDVINTLTAKESDKIYVVPGSATSPEPLENIVVDTKVGDILSTRITYTEDDTDIEELIGKTITLTVTVHEIARLTVTRRHTVEVKFTAKLANDEIPLSTILPLLEGGNETVDLADPEDSFNTVFSPEELAGQIAGCRKYETVAFSLTVPQDKATEYGYEQSVTINFEVTVLRAVETPTEMTDELITEVTAGAYTTAEAYLAFCREKLKEDAAFGAVVKAAVFKKDLPKKEYDEMYTDNYNAALYAVVGDVGGYTEEQLNAMLSDEVRTKIEDMAKENTEEELRERLILEYLFDLLKIKLTDDEYNEKLAELYKTYQNEYYYMLYYYGINDKEALAEYLGVDYLKAQFCYEKMLPVLKEQVTFTD